VLHNTIFKNINANPTTFRVVPKFIMLKSFVVEINCAINETSPIIRIKRPAKKKIGAILKFKSLHLHHPMCSMENQYPRVKQLPFFPDFARIVNVKNDGNS
jgi:hypothetical protein